MNTIINDLLNFVETGNVSKNLLAIDAKLGKSDLGDVSRLRDVAIKILGWLRGIARLKKIYPLRLNTNYEWCNDLQIFLNNSSEISEYFEIIDWKLQFKSNVNSDEITNILRIVEKEYNPVLRR